MGSEYIKDAILNLHFREGTVVEIALVPDGDVPYEDYVLRLAWKYSDRQYADGEYEHDLISVRTGYDFYMACKDFLKVQHLTADDMIGIKFIECYVRIDKATAYYHQLIGMYPINNYELITDYKSWFLDKLGERKILDLSAWNADLHPECCMD